MLPFDPKKPLCGFPMRALHAQRRIHLFADDECIYFRPKNAPDDWWGCLWPSVLFRWVNNRQFSLLSVKVEKALSHSHFFRVLFFKDTENNRTWKIFFHPELSFISSTFRFRGAVCFVPSLTPRLNLWKTHTDGLKQFISTAWQNEGSDMRQAIPFLSENEDEKSWRAIEWKRGNQKELESALFAACWMDDEVWQWWKDEKLILRWNQEFRIGFGSSLRDGVIYGLSKLSLRLQRVIERILEHNKSCYRLPTGRRDDLGPPWWEGYNTMTSRAAGVVLPIAPPTQHERLEAALYLREWLINNAPDLLSDWFEDL